MPATPSTLTMPDFLSSQVSAHIPISPVPARQEAMSAVGTSELPQHWWCPAPLMIQSVPYYSRSLSLIQILIKHWRWVWEVLLKQSQKLVNINQYQVQNYQRRQNTERKKIEQTGHCSNSYYYWYTVFWKQHSSSPFPQIILHYQHGNIKLSYLMMEEQF